ncbi:MAG: Stp1/IreP family PP2C-type Ser/Thr phosphatase [Eubacterium sp.]|nr:Stp1/IreP family PP2C-type Ser/Thr phosphatase [Eubacterium sp.]
MDSFSLTDIGRTRDSNQDSVFSEESSVGFFSNLFLVADGMGGHNAGDLASKICIEEFVNALKRSDKRTPVSALEDAVAYANGEIIKKAASDPAYAGMGTTLVGMTVNDGTAYIVNIGDSRLYLMRDKLRQITVDHSLVEEMVKNGEIGKDQMRTHPNKNIITRALGTTESPVPDCFEIEVAEGDVFLLCSDGLSNMLDDRDMEKIITEEKDLKVMGKKLVDAANDAGGKDNISVVLVRID